jgi:hypothetical protein
MITDLSDPVCLAGISQSSFLPWRVQGLSPPPALACGYTSPGWSNDYHLTLPLQRLWLGPRGYPIP